MEKHNYQLLIDQSSLYLKRLTLAVISITAIQLSTVNSLITEENPSPCIIIFFMAIIYHFAGIISDNQRSIAGIFSIGNIIPESIIIGSIITIPDISSATICLSTADEMSSPSASETKINISEIRISNHKLPLIGTPSTKTEIIRMVARLITETKK